MKQNGGIAIAELPRVLTDARAARGLSLRQAAVEIGCAPSTLMRVEQRLHQTDARTLERLATWLRCRIVIPPDLPF